MGLGPFHERPGRLMRVESKEEEAARLGNTRTAPEFLTTAAEIMAQRGKQYDKPSGERSMGKCVAAFNTVTGRDLSEAEGWFLLQMLKDVRLFQNAGFHQDSADDCIAYAALKAEAKQKEQQ